MRPVVSDECLDGRLVRWLVDAGFDLARSRDVAPSAPDEEVAALALRLERVLITSDRGFGDLIPMLPATHPGILVVPQGSPPYDRIETWIRRMLADCEGGLVAFERANIQRFGTTADWSGARPGKPSNIE